tara:strand:- start:1950 stop:2792 length:843 start_codon:yes stop_codon:yes gene_type:complete
MRIALTGASGLLGRAIAGLAVSQGHSVIGIDRASKHHDLPGDMEFIQAEMDDYDALVTAFAGCDALVHMAAIPSPGRHPDHIVHNNNVVGSYNALHAAAENAILRVCQASSVNAIGHAYSRHPRYDFFPIDETHPNYAEDPYSLSKWICEQQAEAFVRRYDGMVIASMRFHYVTQDRAMAVAIYPVDGPNVDKHLWAWTNLHAAADACLRSLSAPFSGHQAFYIVSPTTTVQTPSRELAARYFPTVPITAGMEGVASFFSSAKAERLLGWNHDAAMLRAR